MPVINICFLCPGPRVPTPELCEWHCRKKNAKNTRCHAKKSTGANRQQPVWMIASLEERRVHFSQVPFRAFMLRTVYFIYIFYLSALPLPNWYSNANLRRPVPLVYSFSDFVMANTQVDVFNFEMNVYCRVSVSFSMMHSLSAGLVCTTRFIATSFTSLFVSINYSLRATSKKNY